MAFNILWYQSEKLNNTDVVSLNGQILPEGVDNNSCFRRLKEISDKAIAHKTPWCGRVNGTYFVKGWFDSVDEDGRQMAFMFISEEKDGRDALMRELSSIGYSMEPDTQECVNKSSSKKIYGKYAILLAIIIIIILTIIVAYGKSD